MKLLKKIFKLNKKNETNIDILSVTSYSQSGEDIIIKNLLENYFQKDKITYLDIGAYHPYNLSNTYIFYKNGSSGICIEPDNFLYEFYKEKRPNDICINAGIGVNGNTEADFFIMSVKTLNTFSRDDAEYVQKEYGYNIQEVVKVKLLNINDIVLEYFNEPPDFVSLDVEGLDYEIIKTFDFNKCRPFVFCIETINFEEDRRKQKKNMEIINHMINNDYFIYGETFINTIFVDKKAWDKY